MYALLRLKFSICVSLLITIYPREAEGDGKGKCYCPNRQDNEQTDCVKSGLFDAPDVFSHWFVDRRVQIRMDGYYSEIFIR